MSNWIHNLKDSHGEKLSLLSKPKLKRRILCDKQLDISIKPQAGEWSVSGISLNVFEQTPPPVPTQHNRHNLRHPLNSVYTYFRFFCLFVFIWSAANDKHMACAWTISDLLITGDLFKKPSMGVDAFVSLKAQEALWVTKHWALMSWRNGTYLHAWQCHEGPVFLWQQQCFLPALTPMEL